MKTAGASYIERMEKAVLNALDAIGKLKAENQTLRDENAALRRKNALDEEANQQQRPSRKKRGVSVKASAAVPSFQEVSVDNTETVLNDDDERRGERITAELEELISSSDEEACKKQAPAKVATVSRKRGLVRYDNPSDDSDDDRNSPDTTGGEKQRLTATTRLHGLLESNESLQTVRFATESEEQSEDDVALALTSSSVSTTMHQLDGYSSEFDASVEQFAAYTSEPAPACAPSDKSSFDASAHFETCKTPVDWGKAIYELLRSPETSQDVVPLQQTALAALRDVQARLGSSFVRSALSGLCGRILAIKKTPPTDTSAYRPRACFAVCASIELVHTYLIICAITVCVSKVTLHRDMTTWPLSF
jgi:hypothetical protein